MYEEYHPKMSFVPPTTLNNLLHTTPTINKPPIDFLQKNHIMTNSNNNNNNSNDKNDQEYNHNNISDAKLRIKDNREEERAEKRSSTIMAVTAITNNDSSISKRSPSFDDLQGLYCTGDHKIRLPRINELSRNSNSSSNRLLPLEAFGSYDSSHEEEKGKGHYEFRDSLGSKQDTFPRRHHSAPACTHHQYYQKQHLKNTFDYHPVQYYASSTTSSSSSSTVSSPPSLSLSSMTVDSNKACPTCNKTFSRSRDRARHISSVHEARKRKKCSLCGCCFTRKDSLLRHQRNETCNNVNARSSPSSTPFLRKGAVYGSTMALSSRPELSASHLLDYA